jgi:hypothetical protein
MARLGPDWGQTRHVRRGSPYGVRGSIRGIDYSDRGEGCRSGRDGDAQLRGRSIYYLEPGGTVRALDFLDACPGAIDAKFTAVLDAVVAASPPRFSGRAKWEAMQG